MKPNKKSEPIEIFAGTTWQAAVVKSLLEDEIIGTLFPWVAAPGGAGSMKVFVSKADHDKAKSVVEKYQNIFE